MFDTCSDSPASRSVVKALLAPLVVCSIIFITFNLSLGLDGFNTGDFLVCLFFSYVLFLVSKDNLFYVVNVFFLVLVGYVVNRLKLQYFGEPVTASDLLSVVALYDIQAAWVKYLVLAVVVLFGLGLAFSFRYTRKNLLIAVAFFLLMPVGYVSALSSLACGKEGCEAATLEEGGSSFNHFAYSLAQLKYELFDVPDAEAVRAANELLGGVPLLYRDTASNIERKRNVYVILVESLWDPQTLKGVQYVADPFYEAFRELWVSGGRSGALSPVFGGGTANAEFELLCGLPVTTGPVKFELPVLNETLPCLPRYLGEQGYTTVASHPNVEGFWNRDAAYPKLGFQHYYAINDFHKEEMISGVYLSDKSLYMQTEARLSRGGLPRFNYILTASQHYPYVEFGDQAGSGVVGVENDYFNRYVKLIRRGSMELFHYYQYIRRQDSDALILILGDHLPLFGRNFAVYKEAGLFAGDASGASEAMYRVPLIVVDGNRGVLNVGTVGMYTIPTMIVRLLQGKRVGDSGELPAGKAHYRPLPNGGMLYGDKRWAFCMKADERASCSKPLRVHEAMNTLVRDVTIGSQYALAPPVGP